MEATPPALTIRPAVEADVPTILRFIRGIFIALCAGAVVTAWTVHGAPLRWLT